MRNKNEFPLRRNLIHAKREIIANLLPLESRPFLKKKKRRQYPVAGSQKSEQKLILEGTWFGLQAVKILTELSF